MPFANVGAVSLHYEILGNAGSWVALVSGARRNMDEVRKLATLIAAAGFRVLLHDRRNTGKSSLSLDGEGSEFEIWADDLHALMQALNLPPMIVGGSSSGCRLATIMALRHRTAVRALVMMRVTGGAFAVKRLANVYYTQYMDAVERGGMAEVCRTDHFRDLIQQDPSRREQILRWDPVVFFETMKRWRESLESGINDPMLGASEKSLRAIDFPVCVIPGNDNTHAIASGKLVHSLIPGAELHELRKDQIDVDLLSMEEWVPNEKLAPVVEQFLRRVSS
jgi:pimeloyl-ACP methyl ester carboxylesterase